MSLRPHNRPSVAEGFKRLGELLAVTDDTELPTPWHGGNHGLMIAFGGPGADRRLHEFAEAAGVEDLALEPWDPPQGPDEVPFNRYRCRLVGLKLDLIAGLIPDDVKTLVPDAESDTIPDEQLEEHDLDELAILVADRERAGILTVGELFDLGLADPADEAFLVNGNGRAVLLKAFADAPEILARFGIEKSA